jgi:hypothetical protein
MYMPGKALVCRVRLALDTRDDGVISPSQRMSAHVGIETGRVSPMQRVRHMKDFFRPLS